MSGTHRWRPLSLPTMHDRAMQALYLLALDPIAETL
jgi:RNA-directed DNA polymerase